MFRVIVPFADLQDKNHVYRAGDTFPRPGLVVEDKRIAELSGFANKLNTPLIEHVGEQDPAQVEEQDPGTRTTAKPKRTRKKNTTNE